MTRRTVLVGTCALALVGALGFAIGQGRDGTNACQEADGLAAQIRENIESEFAAVSAAQDVLDRPNMPNQQKATARKNWAEAMGNLVDQLERRALVVEQNSSCFSAEERLRAEADFRQWQRALD